MSDNVRRLPASAAYLLANTCRLLVSATFVFSGVVKILDPVGTQYKIEDYLAAFGLHGVLPPPLPLGLAIALAMVEFCLGVYLLFGIRRRWTTRLILLFMLFYTPLTLWLALTDGVADCGCFGDAVVLTNWQTFWKNALLLAAAWVLCRTRRYQVRLISTATQWIISLYSILWGLLVALACTALEPFVDFRPFYVGQDIQRAMEWPDDDESLPEIMDFTIEPIDGDVPTTDIDTETLLADTAYTFLLIAPHLETADDASLEDINAVADYAQEHGYRFLCLTASGTQAIHRWQDLTGAEYPFAFCDELTLKTVLRSNPGLLLLHGPQIAAKFSNNNMPSAEDLDRPLDDLSLAHQEKEDRPHKLLLLAAFYFVPLLPLMLIDRIVTAIRWWWRRRKAAKLAQ